MAAAVGIGQCWREPSRRLSWPGSTQLSIQSLNDSLCFEQEIFGREFLRVHCIFQIFGQQGWSRCGGLTVLYTNAGVVVVAVVVGVVCGIACCSFHSVMMMMTMTRVMVDRCGWSGLFVVVCKMWKRRSPHSCCMNLPRRQFFCCGCIGCCYPGLR